MRTAIVHYWLLKMRGGEKVIEALCEMFPQADIFTHVVDLERLSPTIRRHAIHTTSIARLPMAKKHYQKYLPLMPRALEDLDLNAYDLVISSESGPAKGVIPAPQALHLCYCHSPMRYLWDQRHEYMESAGAATRLAFPPLAHNLRIWDVTTAARVDQFVANSRHVAARIRKYYRRDSEVIAPPVDVAAFAPQPGQAIGDYHLAAGELVAYKRFDLVVEAFRRVKRKLVVIGDGEQRAKLQALGGDAVTWLGRVDDAELRRRMAEARALVFPGLEDFGIIPVEAMAAGRPVICFGRAGVLDSVVDGVTGLYFAEQTVEAVVDAVERFEARFADFADRAPMIAQAGRFSREAFKARMGELLMRLGADLPPAA